MRRFLRHREDPRDMPPLPLRVEIHEDEGAVDISTTQPPLTTTVTTDPTQFPCTACPRIFLQKNMLTRHLCESHGQILDWECDLCELSFTVRYSLQKHMVKVHRTERNPYNCPNCPKKFTQQKQLESHECAGKMVRIVPLKKLTRREWRCGCGKVFEGVWKLRRHQGGCSKFKCLRRNKLK